MVVVRESVARLKTYRLQQAAAQAAALPGSPGSKPRVGSPGQGSRASLRSIGAALVSLRTAVGRLGRGSAPPGPSSPLPGPGAWEHPPESLEGKGEVFSQANPLRVAHQRGQGSLAEPSEGPTGMQASPLRAALGQSREMLPGTPPAPVSTSSMTGGSPRPFGPCNPACFTTFRYRWSSVCMCWLQHCCGPGRRMSRSARLVSSMAQRIRAARGRVEFPLVEVRQQSEVLAPTAASPPCRDGVGVGVGVGVGGNGAAGGSSGSAVDGATGPPPSEPAPQSGSPGKQRPSLAIVSALPAWR